MKSTTRGLVHNLAYSWTGWPKSGDFPAEPGADFFKQLADAWAADTLVPISRRWQRDIVQFTFEAGPGIAPEKVAARAKGRLDHALRAHGWHAGLARKVAVRSLGENTLDAVLRYIATQLDRADLADPRYAQSLAQAAWEDGAVDLSKPLASGHGRYWYNLHLVAVTDGRWRIGREDYLGRMASTVRTWSSELSGGTATGEMRAGVHSLAVMPDHVHVAVRAPSAMPPTEVATGLRRALNSAARCALFSDRLYAGTFSDYPLSHVRPRP